MAAGPGGKEARAGLTALRYPRRVRSGAASEERALPQLGAAGISLSVPGDVGGARSRRVQAGDHRTVLAQDLPVEGSGQNPMVNPAYIALGRG